MVGRTRTGGTRLRRDFPCVGDHRSGSESKWGAAPEVAVVVGERGLLPVLVMGVICAVFVVYPGTAIRSFRQSGVPGSKSEINPHHIRIAAVVWFVVFAIAFAVFG
jgi:hypothetical protein